MKSAQGIKRISHAGYVVCTTMFIIVGKSSRINARTIRGRTKYKAIIKLKPSKTHARTWIYPHVYEMFKIFIAAHLYASLETQGHLIININVLSNSEVCAAEMFICFTSYIKESGVLCTHTRGFYRLIFIFSFFSGSVRAHEYPLSTHTVLLCCCWTTCLASVKCLKSVLTRPQA